MFFTDAPSQMDGLGSRPDCCVGGCAASRRGSSGVRAIPFSLGREVVDGQNFERIGGQRLVFDNRCKLTEGAQRFVGPERDHAIFARHGRTPFWFPVIE